MRLLCEKEPLKAQPLELSFPGAFGQFQPMVLATKMHPFGPWNPLSQESPSAALAMGPKRRWNYGEQVIPVPRNFLCKQHVSSCSAAGVRELRAALHDRGVFSHLLDVDAQQL